MTSHTRILLLAVVAAIALPLLSGCGAGGSALPGQPGLPAIGSDPANAPVGAAAGVNVFGLTQRSIHIVMITHGEASSLFWPVVQNGAQAAAAQLGVSVTYEAPDRYHIARMSQLIEAAIATGPACRAFGVECELDGDGWRGRCERAPVWTTSAPSRAGGPGCDWVG